MHFYHIRHSYNGFIEIINWSASKDASMVSCRLSEKKIKKRENTKTHIKPANRFGIRARVKTTTNRHHRNRETFLYITTCIEHETNDTIVLLAK